MDKKNYHVKKKQRNASPVTKQVLVLKGHSSSQVINDALKDIGMLARPNCRIMSKKNDILPFEDAASIEFLSEKNNCGLFAFGSHTKKRPNNLVLGRLYENQIIDMYEFGVDAMKTIHEFSGQKKSVGAKPMMVFQGDQWQNDSLYTSIQNMLLDFFRGDKTEKISLDGLDHAMVFTCVMSKIHIRVYALNFIKGDSKTPKVVFKPMGPFMDLTVRRTQTPPADVMKEACKKPKNLAPKALKNISSSSMGDKLGRIHMKKQNFEKMGGKRMAVLRHFGKNDSKNDSNDKELGGKRSNISDSEAKSLKKAKK